MSDALWEAISDMVVRAVPSPSVMNERAWQMSPWIGQAVSKMIDEKTAGVFASRTDAGGSVEPPPSAFYNQTAVIVQEVMDWLLGFGAAKTDFELMVIEGRPCRVFSGKVGDDPILDAPTAIRAEGVTRSGDLAADAAANGHVTDSEKTRVCQPRLYVSANAKRVHQEALQRLKEARQSRAAAKKALNDAFPEARRTSQ